MWKNLSNYRDAALLFLRITLGILFIYLYGWRSLAGGLPKWKALGGAMRHVGISFWPAFWGFMAAFSESIGVGLLVVGLCFRPSCLLLVITMAVAAISDYHQHGLGGAAHALDLLLIFTTLIFLGPGKYSVDQG